VRFHVRRNDLFVLVPTVAAAVAFVALVASWTSLTKLWITNGLTVPLTVEVDGERVTVAPGARESLHVAGGVHALRALSPQGDVLEDEIASVPGGGFAIYDPLGASLIYQATVTYAEHPGSAKPDVNVLGGAPLITGMRADFLFEEPPRSIQVQAGASTTRTVIDQAKGGYKAKLGYLEEHDQTLRVAELARAVSRALPNDEAVRARAQHAIGIAEGTDAAVAFARRARDRLPGDFDLNRAYQSALRRAGRLDEARAEYRARFEASPDSTEAAVLLARVEPLDQARARVDGVLAAHPDSGVALFFAAVLADEARDFAATDALLARASREPGYARYADMHARALVALGRAPEAARIVALHSDQDAAFEGRAALLYAQIARIGGVGGNPDVYIDQLAARPGGGPFKTWAASVLGTPASDQAQPGADPSERDTREAAGIHLAAARDPAEAWKLCASAPRRVLASLYPGAAVLLAAEFARAGDRSLAERMLWERGDLGLPPSEILDWAAGGPAPPDPWRLDHEARAAIDLVRARAFEAQGKPAAPLYDAAERGDIPGGLVARARRAWPPLAAPAPPARPASPRR
jgi:hypothetical protein